MTNLIGPQRIGRMQEDTLWEAPTGCLIKWRALSAVAL